VRSTVSVLMMTDISKKGPVIPNEMPEKANDSELKQRYKELNQDEPSDK
jgi:hypothetical protein